MIHRDDAYGSGLRDAVHARVCLDDAATFDCENAFFSRSYGKDTEETDQTEAIIELKAFKPDVIVLIGFLEDGIAFMNFAAQEGFTRFILTDGTKSGDLIGAVPDELLCKAIGTNPASPSGTSYQAFALRYESRWKEPPGAFNANAYDALYLLGYAIAAAGDLKPSELTGAALATAMGRLSEGAEVNVGNSKWNASIQALRNGENATIDLVGASGALTFDSATGEAPAEIEAWFLDLKAAEVASLGEIFSAEGSYTDPVFNAVCEAAGEDDE